MQEGWLLRVQQFTPRGEAAVFRIKSSGEDIVRFLICKARVILLHQSRIHAHVFLLYISIVWGVLQSNSPPKQQGAKRFYGEVLPLVSVMILIINSVFTFFFLLKHFT